MYFGQFIIVRTIMEGRHNLGIFLLGSLLMPLGVLAVPADFLEVVEMKSSSTPAPVCLSDGCVVTAADLLQQMDRKVDPCQDFYKFACGGFVADTVLSQDKTSTGFSL